MRVALFSSAPLLPLPTHSVGYRWLLQQKHSNVLTGSARGWTTVLFCFVAIISPFTVTYHAAVELAKFVLQ